MFYHFLNWQVNTHSPFNIFNIETKECFAMGVYYGIVYKNYEYIKKEN